MPPAPEARAAFDAGKAVLRRLYETEPDIQVVYRAYIAATGLQSSLLAMRSVAQGIGLHRRHKFRRKIGSHIVEQLRKLEQDAAEMLRVVAEQHITYAAAARMLGVSRARATLMRKRGLLPEATAYRPPRPRKFKTGKTIADLVEERKQRAAVVQRLMDSGMTATEAAAHIGYSRGSVNKMVADGLVIRRIPFRPVPPRRVFPPAQPKPQKPKATYQSVEDWLAAGNQIKRCPTVAALPTTALIPEEDRAALTAHYAALAAAPKEKRRWNQF